MLVDSISPEEPDIDAFLEEIEFLRDPSHVRSHRLSAWLTLLNASGFTVQTSREFGIYLDLPSWTQRMRTPSASVEKIEQLFSTALPATRERLRIEKKDDAFGFTLPTGLILAHRS